MLASLLAAAPSFTAPTLDYHALAPELVLAATFTVVLLVDLFTEQHNKWLVSSLTGIGFLAAAVPLLTLAMDGSDRAMFGGAYVVDDFALVLKALFLVAGYLTVLISTNYIAEGDYWEGEYYTLLVGSVLGMVVMASARDLITMFVALELLSIPAYLLAGWRKRVLTGNEAGLKYYLMGVFASAVMLYGMSLVYGGTGSTLFASIGEAIDGSFGDTPVAALGMVFILVGFGFKVSAVPFHNWAPDTYEGAPTPITAFLSVASKAAGFVALMELIFVAFYGRDDIYGPLMFVLATATMTVGNLIALRQTNVVRLFAYSSIAQAGFILAPLAVAGQSATVGADAIQAVVIYLIIYTVMNLGAFAVIVAVARKTGSAELSTWGGLFQYAPGLTVAMTVFLFSLAGIPPLGGWFAKFQVFRTVVEADTGMGYALGVIVAVNSVIALFYYANVARQMWFEDAPDGDLTPIRIPASLTLVMGVAVVGVIVFGFAPGTVGHFGDAATDLLAIAGR
ncbi:NADH-quinone oxidoreductase subunit N [Iamia majanohamensis]|uniref:NADH-quinone oxidoreductase subunit N n=1 Tax=Iamia majanohamensis TaxID=467976 RepID=A0AAE9Y6W1_9ACTN|nr:NADH-quinone oxidoreductase subunit N [Iamia majanohamensis]WCO66706.1 NADH-quinone oxidoreductase subunit N [Iamia majanohamensis]